MKKGNKKTVLPPVTSDDKNLPFKCKICPFKGEIKSQLRDHIQNYHDKTRKFKCNLCERKCHTQAAVKSHVKLVHLKIFDHQCPYCPTKSFTSADLKRHIGTVHKRCEFDSCRKKFESYQKVLEHLSDEHGKVRSCTSIARLGGKNKNKATLKKQQNLRFSCDKCSKTFTAVVQLQLHKKRRHSSPKQKSAVLINPPENIIDSTLEMAQIPPRNFNCGKCDKAFSTAMLLKIHSQRKHDNPANIEDNNNGGSKLHRCETCGKGWSTKERLQQHVDHLHNRLRKEACHMCTKRFFTKRFLRKHIEEVHEDSEEIKCDICDSTFRHQQDLNDHISLVHMGTERQRSVRRLTRSLKTPGLIKHSCAQCGKITSSRGKLHFHINRVHKKLKQKQCPKCPKKCFSLEKHIKKKHPEDNVNEEPVSQVGNVECIDVESESTGYDSNVVIIEYSESESGNNQNNDLNSEAEGSRKIDKPDVRARFAGVSSCELLEDLVPIEDNPVEDLFDIEDEIQEEESFQSNQLSPIEEVLLPNELLSDDQLMSNTPMEITVPDLSDHEVLDNASNEMFTTDQLMPCISTQSETEKSILEDTTLENVIIESDPLTTPELMPSISAQSEADKSIGQGQQDQPAFEPVIIENDPLTTPEEVFESEAPSLTQLTLEHELSTQPEAAKSTCQSQQEESALEPVIIESDPLTTLEVLEAAAPISPVTFQNELTTQLETDKSTSQGQPDEPVTMEINPFTPEALEPETPISTPVILQNEPVLQPNANETDVGNLADLDCFSMEVDDEIRNSYDLSPKKQHSCDLCPSKFHKKQHLDIHVNSVHAKTGCDYKCRKCGESFESAWFMVKHYREKH